MAHENETIDTIALTSDEQEALVRLLKHPEIVKLIKAVETKDSQ